MKRRVLVADGDDAHVGTLRDILADDGCELAVARTVDDCLELFPVFRPDVVLADARLEGGGGRESCRRIKADPGNDTVLIVIMSSANTIEERVRAYEAGAIDCIARPVHRDELRTKLRVLFRLDGALKALGEARDAVKKHNSRLERMVRERTEEVVSTRDATVFALAKLAESRDPETGEHLERICRYTRILGEELSRDGPYTHLIDDYFLDDLYRSCPLHDIGKVGIPDVILLKPGRLTREEFEVMKRHTVIGAEALELAIAHSSATFLTMAAEVARCHHERWDGKGYLAGLKGEDIPLSARIVALADMFDALTSVRIYKEAYPPALARSLILDEEGKHLDPAVVEAFRATYPEFLEVHRRFNMEADSRMVLEDSTLIREVIGE